MVEAMNRAIADGKTGYCPAAGIMPLREALAADVGARRGLDYPPANVVVQPGGKPVIGKFIQTVMNPGEGVLYPNPGYPIYESMIEYYGGQSLPYRYVQTDTGLRHRPRPPALAHHADARAAIIYNNLQNPLGCESTPEEMQAIADIAIEHDLIVLADEAYFEMRYSGESHSIASLPGMYERTVLLYTFSKKFAMTGWRLGAAIAPLPIAESIAKLNTNDESCTTHFVQAAGVEGIVGSQDGPKAILAELERRRDAAWGELAQIDGFVCPKPDATFYLFPKVTDVMARMGFDDVGDVRHRGAAPHRRVVLHPQALRPTAAGRGRPLRALRLLGPVGRRHPGGPVGPASAGSRRVVMPRRASPSPAASPTPGSNCSTRRATWSRGTRSTCPRVERCTRWSRGADAVLTLLTTKVDDAFLDAAGPQLKVVANVAVGYNNIDVAACATRGVVCTNTPGVLTEATADIAMALVLMATRRLGEGERVIRSGTPWQWGMFYMLGSGIQGRRLGIVGMGDIGQALARRARAFGMTIAYSNRKPVAPRGRGRARRRVHEPRRAARHQRRASASTARTRRPRTTSSARAQLAMMKPSAFLVNTARGPIVDEAALVDALQTGSHRRRRPRRVRARARGAPRPAASARTRCWCRTSVRRRSRPARRWPGWPPTTR